MLRLLFNSFVRCLLVTGFVFVFSLPISNVSRVSFAETVGDVDAGVSAYEEERYEEAFRIFSDESNISDPVAQSNLGYMYTEGLGVEQDYEEGVKWYRKAAEQGHAQAQNNLGFIYESGLGVEQDYGEALKWYRRSSAEQGYAAGQSNMGWMYQNGFAVERDYEEALEWYRKVGGAG